MQRGPSVPVKASIWPVFDGLGANAQTQNLSLSLSLTLSLSHTHVGDCIIYEGTENTPCKSAMVELVG